MRAGEETSASGMCGCDCQGLEKFPRKNSVEVKGQFGALREFSYSEFGGNFPS